MINSIISIMSSRRPYLALRCDSPAMDSLVCFLAYLSEWETHASGTRGFLSDSTATGLRVTISSTISLLDYLTKHAGFQYLLTAKLNQEPVENAFGVVRQCSGCNDHPTPQQFLVSVNCLSFCNLVRSPDRGNAQPAILHSLVRPGLNTTPTTNQKQALADELVGNLEFDAAEQVLNLFISQDDHSLYAVAKSDRRLIHYISGYAARKCLLPLKCAACEKLLLCSRDHVDSSCSPAELTKLCDYGGLLYPSLSLLTFITLLEDKFPECFSTTRIHHDSILDVIEILKGRGIGMIGCDEHRHQLTMRVMSFYLLARMHFFVKAVNRARMSRRKAARERKKSRCS